MTGSLRKTASEMGLSCTKTRKALITYGEYSTPFSNEVLNLRCKGYSIDEIAKELGTTTKRVTDWLPYEKSMYNMEDRSQDAVRSDNYRKRIKQAQRNSVQNKIENDKKEILSIIKGNQFNTFTTTSVLNEHSPKNPVRLHIKLMDNCSDAERKRILRKYGRSTTGNSIERDILIPADMTLHALHYAIQRLYGWGNSHLRSFRLPPEIYQELTNNTVRGWGNLIGVLFQTTYPEYAQFAQYGDDDYEHGSHRVWLRKKYTGPYGYLNDFERYNVAVAEFEDFTRRFLNMAVYEPFDLRKGNKGREERITKHASVIDLTLDELNASIVMEEGTEDLLERLTVTSVLAPTGTATAGFAELNQRMVNRLYVNDFDEIEEPEVKPVTTKLIYKYDYGDGWKIEITMLKDCFDLLEEGYITDKELTDAKNTVIDKYKPVCIHQDGIFVVDDVGGFGGFVDFLRILNESDNAEEKEQMRAWASGMGWNTRRVRNREML